MKSITSKLFCKIILCCALTTSVFAQSSLTLFGDGSLKNGETPSYVNSLASKGGAITNGVLGSFDTVNPFNLKGVAGPEIRHFTIESLMKRHMDEPFALYPSLAKRYELKNGVLTFELNENARFSDGEKLTANHILTSFNLLKTHGRPNFRTYYDKVSKIDVLEGKIVFYLQDLNDKELPLILALMPVFKMPGGVDFQETTLNPLIGTGAYKITSVKIGERLTLTKNDAWWGKDLQLNKGQQNFETLNFDFYRDATAYLEAFKKGLIDWRLEREPQKWQDLQQSEQVKKGEIVLHEIETKLPHPFRAFHFNTRRAHLASIEVRKALHLLFNGDFINQQIFLGRYQRLYSSFERSELQGSFSSQQAMNERETLREALKYFKAAGFELKSGKLTGVDGKPFTLEFIVNSKDQERLATATCSSYQKAGVTCDIRLLDSAQYQARSMSYDFDILEHTLTNSLSPGNEQFFYWSSKVADEAGSRNYSGLKNKEIDALISKILTSSTRQELVENAKIFDKKLMETYVTLPLFQPPKQWLALQKHIKMPSKQSIYGYLPEVWWRE